MKIEYLLEAKPSNRILTPNPVKDLPIIPCACVLVSLLSALTTETVLFIVVSPEVPEMEECQNTCLSK